MHANSSKIAVSGSWKENQNVWGEPGSSAATTAETWKRTWEIASFCKHFMHVFFPVYNVGCEAMHEVGLLIRSYNCQFVIWLIECAL